MAEKYGFFDAVVTNGVADRVYSSEDLNDIFKGILSDGVFRLYENALNITAGDGLSVNVDTGKAIVRDHWYLNTTVKNITVNTAHATLNRYSSIILRYNRANRSVTMDIIDGEPDSTPALPALTQNNDIFEIRLANIDVTAGITELTDIEIEDVRPYTSGVVDAPALAYRRYDTIQTGYSSGQKYFDIPSEYNLTPNTYLSVYSDGALCMESEYTIMINEVEGNYMVRFEENRPLNTKLSFIMIN